MATSKIQVTLTHERDTKGTRVFKTDDVDAPVNQLYVRKPYANDLPDRIRVVIEEAK